jgi:hypothetical protein
MESSDPSMLFSMPMYQARSIDRIVTIRADQAGSSNAWTEEADLCRAGLPLRDESNALDHRFALPQPELTARFEKAGYVGSSAECNDAAVG